MNTAIPRASDWAAAPDLLEGSTSSELTVETCGIEYWLNAVTRGTLLGQVHGHLADAAIPEYLLEPGPLRTAILQEFAFRTVSEDMGTRAITHLVRTAPDAATMCITNTTACTTFTALAASPSWTLTSGAGTKTVIVFLRDAAGNTTTATTSPHASIVVDATAPTNGTVTATRGNAQIQLAWTGFADPGSGIASYRVVAAQSATAPASCTGTPLWTGTDRGVTATGLSNGKPYAFRVCAVDAAGNLSTGATASATPLPEADAPVGTLAGPALVNTTAVTLALAATDASGVAQMCITEATTCTAFVTYATSYAFHLTTTNGSHTVRAWFRDTWGTTSSAPVTTAIVLDTAAPTGGTLSATASAGKVALAWTVATDAVSGLDGYRLVGQAGSVAPATCNAGTLLYAGAATSFAQTLASKTTWSYRLCAKDKAGNMSAGTTKTATTPQ